MKRIAFFTLSLTLVFMLSGCKASQPDGTAVLRYDGVYCYIRDFDSNGLMNNYALRFYEDGTVIHTSVEQQEPDGNYLPRSSWFNKENEYYTGLLGSYKLADGSITLTTYSPDTSVAYQGTVWPDKLVLDSHAANGHEVTGSEYVFYPFEDASN